MHINNCYKQNPMDYFYRLDPDNYYMLNQNKTYRVNHSKWYLFPRKCYKLNSD